MRDQRDGKEPGRRGPLIGRSRASEVLSRRRALPLEQIRESSRAWALPLDLLAKEAGCVGAGAGLRAGATGLFTGFRS